MRYVRNRALATLFLVAPALPIIAAILTLTIYCSNNFPGTPANPDILSLVEGAGASLALLIIAALLAYPFTTAEHRDTSRYDKLRARLRLMMSGWEGSPLTSPPSRRPPAGPRR